MKERVVGFDVARAYAIFGMYIVNFNFCFGSFQNEAPVGKFLNLFTGNSTAIFIICAGMGVSLLMKKALTKEDKKVSKSIILKRSWFLFGIGLLLYNWWPGDILHFYGGYMHVAAFLLFVPRHYLLTGAVLSIAVFHCLLFIIPVFTGWDLATFRYVDFWTVEGFFRNTFYNGWNSLFPWIAYFLLGMWLGSIDWQNTRTRKVIFFTSLTAFALMEVLRKYAVYQQFDRKLLDYIMYDYFPPYLPFMVITASFALMVIATCSWLGETFSNNKLLKWFAIAGKMTLTNYVVHLTIGMLILQAISGRTYTGFLQTGMPLSPLYILAYSTAFFALSVFFNVQWNRKFGRGPLELVMRKISD